MSSDPIRRYMTEVLGVSEILLPKDFGSQSVAPSFPTQANALESGDQHPERKTILGDLASARLAIFIALGPRLYPLQGEVFQLAQKMVAAMKLSERDVAWVQWEQVQEGPAPAGVLELFSKAKPAYKLVFGEGSAASLGLRETSVGSWSDGQSASPKSNQNGKALVTYSPFELVDSPEKKRGAWQHLQGLMREMKIG